jgi:hypothetical protein
VAIQHDGDLSRIEDNTKLNSIVAHEDILINEKFQTAYTMKIDSFLFMGTNKPVKITDSRSGLVRRVIDVHPTGVTIPYERYIQLMNQVNFELGSIAQHCLDVYKSLGKSYYNAYQPVEMMAQTDYFYNFVASAYDVFEEKGGVASAEAWSMFKDFLEEQKLGDIKMPKFKFDSELRNYFHTFEQRIKIDGEWIWGWYSGFDTDRFVKHNMIDARSETITLDSTTSILDEVLEVQPAQHSRTDNHGDEVPERRWDRVKTILREIDTRKLHFVKVPQNHIVIDFDLKDETGEKSLELNLEAASKWPTTYAEASKSGEGIHLHYLYDGDTELLRSAYSEGIEVKVFKGNSSLRRRLSRCNNEPIATISSGLPLKEKKVLNEDAILSERQIRNHILSAMRKEIHPGTKSNIDFIAHILNEAYEKGTDYDVTDMKAGIIKFALGSTNQSERALDTVTRMKFASENASEAVSQSVPQEDPDAKLVFWDCEVYPNLFGIVYKKEGDHDFVTLINPTPQECQNLMRMKLVGFNCRKYDNHILYARSLGYTNAGLYELSQKIISNNPNALFGAAYDISYTDVYDYASEKMTLKKWEIKLGIKHVEMDIPWDKDVPEDRIDDVMAYCANDVAATEAVHNARKGDYTARLILAELSGLTPNHTTNAHSGAIIFGKNKRPQSQFNYVHLDKQFVGYVFDKGVSTYRGEVAGEGGYVYSEPGIYENVALLDVASMHPTSIEQMNLFGDEYTKKFSEMKAARMAIKRKDWETAGTMLDGRLKPYLEDTSQAKMLSDALKIVINSVYGLTSARFDNVFKDPRNKDNIVAKRGALFMIDLKHYVQNELGAQVVHIKTDSIKIPNATPEQIEKINEFGKKYGYDFEHEATYEKFALVNDAVYVARTGGKWSATGAEFQQPYIFKTLFTQEEIEFDDLCVAKSVLKGSMYLKYTPEIKGEEFTFVDNENVRFIGRTGLFCPVKEEAQGAGSLWRVLDDKPYAVAGTKGYLWKEANMTIRDEIDMEYFETQANKAVETIEKFGSFEELVKQ